MYGRREGGRQGGGVGVNNSNDFPQPGTVQDVDGCTGEGLCWVYLASVCFFTGRREGVVRTRKRRRRRRASVSCQTSWMREDVQSKWFHLNELKTTLLHLQTLAEC